MRIPKSESVII